MIPDVPLRRVALLGVGVALFSATLFRPPTVAAQPSPALSSPLVTSPSETSSSVTEAEFLSVLDVSDPAVADAVEALALARARTIESARFSDPLLGVQREDPSGPTAQTDWTLSWQLPHLDRGPRLEAREAAVRAAEARVAGDLLALRLEMRRLYAEWALASARQEVQSRLAVRVEELARVVAARAERGEASGLEAARLRMSAQGWRTRAELAATAVRRARAEARVWAPGLSPEARPILPDLAPPPEPDVDPVALPSLRAARAELEAAQLARDASGRYVRSPELLLGWQEQDLGSTSVDGPLVGLAWSIPVFDRKRAEKASSEARLAGARAGLDRVERRVAATRSAARDDYRSLVAVLDAIQADGTDHDRLLAGAEAAFRLGETGLTDLLETWRSVAESELTLLDLHGAALAAERTVERLAGAPLPSFDDPTTGDIP